MVEILIGIIWILILLGIFKILIVGSEFDFRIWWRYRNKYADWYFNRDTFYVYLSKKQKTNMGDK